MKIIGSKTSGIRLFTLIELLMVITIFMILVALLMPVLSRAKEKARRVLCLSNQRQLVVQLVNYASDYDSYVPIGYHANQKQSNYLIGGANGRPKMIGLVVRSGYLDHPELLYCPSATFSRAMYDTLENPWINPSFSGHSRAGYSCRPVVNWGDGASYPSNMMKARQLGNATVLADWTCSVGWDIESRHRDGMMATGLDGAGRWVPADNFMDLLLTQRGPMWPGGSNPNQDRIWERFDQQ